MSIVNSRCICHIVWILATMHACNVVLTHAMYALHILLFDQMWLKFLCLNMLDFSNTPYYLAIRSIHHVLQHTDAPEQLARSVERIDIFITISTCSSSPKWVTIQSVTQYCAYKQLHMICHSQMYFKSQSTSTSVSHCRNISFCPSPCMPLICG